MLCPLFPESGHVRCKNQGCPLCANSGRCQSTGACVHNPLGCSQAGSMVDRATVFGPILKGTEVIDFPIAHILSTFPLKAERPPDAQ